MRTLVSKISGTYVRTSITREQNREEGKNKKQAKTKYIPSNLNLVVY